MRYCALAPGTLYNNVLAQNMSGSPSDATLSDATTKGAMPSLGDCSDEQLPRPEVALEE